MVVLDYDTGTAHPLTVDLDAGSEVVEPRSRRGTRGSGSSRVPNDDGFSRPEVQEIDSLYQVSHLQAFLIPRDVVPVVRYALPPVGEICQNQVFVPNVDDTRIPSSLAEADCSRSCSACIGRVKPLRYNLDVLQKYQTTTKRQVYRPETVQLTLRCVCVTALTDDDDDELTFSNPPNPDVAEDVYTVTDFTRVVTDDLSVGTQLGDDDAQDAAGQMCQQSQNKEYLETNDAFRIPSSLPEVDCESSCRTSCPHDWLPVSTYFSILRRLDTNVGIYIEDTEPVTVACVCRPN